MLYSKVKYYATVTVEQLEKSLLKDIETLCLLQLAYISHY